MVRWALVALTVCWARRGVAKAKAGQGRRRRQKGEKGHARGHVSQKGDSGDGGVKGMLVACSLGVVAKVAGRDVAGERQRQNFKGLTWVAAGGGEGERSKGGKNAEGTKKRGSGGGLREKDE